MADRAYVFIDGNNWYHGLKRAGVVSQGALDFRAISEKLVGPREWKATLYYVGRLRQEENPTLYAEQRSFFRRLTATDRRIHLREGRIEPRPAKNKLAEELKSYLSNLTTQIDKTVYRDLIAMASKHLRVKVYVEKAVDVSLAVDMVTMAIEDSYDAAYLLSADGDYTPAVEAVRKLQKKVYIASAQPGAKLAGVANSFIRLDPDWFLDCYASP